MREITLPGRRIQQVIPTDYLIYPSQGVIDDDREVVGVSTDRGILPISDLSAST